MIEIVLPEWMGWLIGAALVLHAIKSVMEIYITKTVGNLMGEEGVDQVLTELREIAREGQVKQ